MASNKWGALLNNLIHRNQSDYMRSQKKSQVIEIVIFAAIAFGAVNALRTYHLASDYGWFDPWIQIGYGQLFPETSFDFSYYKESRIISILWTAFILKFDSSIVNIFWELLVVATSVMTYLTFRLANKSRIISITGGIFVALAYPLWGDYAGGGDYYNTLGNLIIAITCYLTFVFLKITHDSNEELTKPKINFYLGILFSLIALETPSGITILLPLQTLIVLHVFQVSKRKKDKTVPKLLKVFRFQILGFFALIFFETLLLILLNQNPNRLFSGPKFLIQSIIDSSITSPWAKPLLLRDFFIQPHLIIFLSLFIVEFLYSLSFLFKIQRQPDRKFALVSAIVPFLFYVLLITLQLLGKTIIFTTFYFLTPVLVTGLILLSRFQFFLSGFWVFASILFPSIFVFFRPNEWVLLLTSLIFLGFLGSSLILRLGKSLSHFGSAFVSFLILTFLMYSLSPFILRSRPHDFNICETARVEMRSEIIKTSTLLDRLGHKRGTLIMGADLELIREPIHSKCGDFNDKSLGGVLIAISQTGFPSAAVLGDVNSDLEYNKKDFIEQSLSYIEDRAKAPRSCYLNFTKLSDGSDLKLHIAGSNLSVDLKCPNE